MNLSDRDRRALIIWVAAMVLGAVVYFWPSGTGDVVPPTVNNVAAAEKRLDRLREIAATVPGKQALADGIAVQLKAREKGLIEAETAAQAQAQLSQLLRKLMRAQSPPMDMGQSELGPIMALGADYGEAPLTVSTTCRIEQLVNLLADLSRQPELIATREMRVNAADARQKTINVRLTISGLVPKRLVPTDAQRRSNNGGMFF
ncbi:MAG: hypothetical protein IT162_12215 [Bryobacterales bacterium]|nr:hypothetical protein [Bryobacterales bacterium]